MDIENKVFFIFLQLQNNDPDPIPNTILIKEICPVNYTRVQQTIQSMALLRVFVNSLLEHSHTHCF